ncbi:TPA: hypothetical protein ACV5ZF_003670 [Salmonella enterica]|uniref:Uncharacterized protein n=1 Tax=Salmonella enterica TaxID=28901 RepID=A0A3V8I899_SALER|nr:hypothetical protein [Salmonella enterica]ECC9158276.1 hypothetical protein [Salmonella enterica subsp. salamae]HCM1852782.1 hypothetical protein [Salmonella enterica subsp. salamae serovar 42:z29:-]AZT24123.1 hypothetical protein ELZ76_09375 [Salmonella enterica subsp. salamae serovar 42:r:-]AZT50422.1 hypothetical protein EL003_09340 [Salmonella enterica subsp. salamae serovar 42:r:-]AZT54781.1 hypothetical protein EL009_09390 [Salmonella enterica subsp. salamae serovar 42:r:-]
MNFDEISFINEVFKRSVEGSIAWCFSEQVPPVIYHNSEITITSCYQSSILNNGAILYLFRYRIPEYDGEYDKFFNVEKIRLLSIQFDRISWQSYAESAPIYNLFDYVSSRYSGLSDFFS